MMMKEIKRIRVALGMSQNQLAKAIALGPSAICNYENGSRRPKISHAIHIVYFARSKGIQTSLDAIYGIDSSHLLAEKSC